MQNISSKEAVCQYIGTSWDGLDDYRYHAGSTKAPVYATDREYIIATANGKRPTKSDQEYISNSEGVFVEASGQSAEYCKSRGRTIWVFKVEQ